MNAPVLQAIEDRRAEIAAQLAALKNEDNELAIAESALKRLLVRGPVGPPAQRTLRTIAQKTATRGKRGRAPKFGDKSQRELVVDALQRAKTPWLDTATIIQTVHATDGIELPKKTLSPLLSVMKREGVILRQGRSVALKQRIAGGKGGHRNAAA